MAIRWLRGFPGRRLKEHLAAPTENHVKTLCRNKERLAFAIRKVVSYRESKSVGIRFQHRFTTMNTTSESLLFRLQYHAQEDAVALDQSAWETFVGLYTPLMFYWARKAGLRQADAADLVQDVLAIVFRRLPDFKYDRQGSFRGWLRTITLNQVRDRKRKKALPIAYASQSQIAESVSVPQAESIWDLDYGRMLLKQAMDQMECDFEPLTWQALLSVMKEDLSVNQAAEKFEVSPWTIYSARSRLIRRLREQLEGML